MMSPRSFVGWMHQLEPRYAPAVFVVTNAKDYAPYYSPFDVTTFPIAGSLRKAVADARESFTTTGVTPTITFNTDPSVLGATVFGTPGSPDNVISLQYGSLGPKGTKTATGLQQDHDAIDFPLVIRD